MDNLGNVAKLFIELGVLNKTPRSGFLTIGIKQTQSVAAHSFRTAVIGYVLAKLEGANADKVMKLCLFHDIPEARIMDTHKVARRYIDQKAAEEKVIAEQAALLPKHVGDDVRALWEEADAQKTKEAIIAKDADYMEGILEAKEYKDNGNKYAQEWIDNWTAALKTESAKKLAKLFDSSEVWWEGLKKFD